MARINGDSPRINPQGNTPPSKAFAAMQAEAGNVGKVSKKPIDNMGKYRDLEEGYAGHMQGRQVTKGFSGAPDIKFPF